MMNQIRDLLSSWYREYEFVTAVYLLEPWEKRIVNSVMAGILIFTLFAGYTYLPHYASSAYALALGSGGDNQ